MAVASVACPKCKKTFRTSDEVKDKRVRCPLCSAAFVVKKFASQEEPPAKAENKANPSADDDDAANPYGVKDAAVVARCPNCANEMESETAVICLYCGYNTQTRSLGKTQRVARQTGGDRFQWLMPGVLSLLGLLALVFLQCLLVLGLGAKYRNEDWWVANLFFNEPAYLWITLIVAGVMWGVGRFVFKRLILEPTPPEQVLE
jgi:DNA-directed RNA polymerase subunit RPC12/RpoP